jgi:hypothetical protein
MYVRWQWWGDRRRKSIRYYRHEKASAYAILVESVRVKGKPTQRHVAYLGSFHSRQRDNIHYRAWWWHDITAKLDRLANRIPSGQRPRIEAALAEKVKPVTAEEVAEVTAFDLKHQEEIRARFGECRWCYFNWPPGQAGVPPRPQFEDKPLSFANTLAAVQRVAAKDVTS